MRATSPRGRELRRVVQWTGDLGMGVRAPEGGQSANRDDEATGSKQLRRAFFRHLNPIDVNDDQRAFRTDEPRSREDGHGAREDDGQAGGAQKEQEGQESAVIATTYAIPDVVVFVTSTMLILVGRSASSQ